MKRASLPGIDELFGPKDPPAEPAAASDEGAPQAPAGGRQGDRQRARAVVRQMAADEGASLRAARDAASSYDLPSPEVGALLRWATANCDARQAVEIGSAGGVSGLWMLEGMAPGGVLTSLEPDASLHDLTMAAFTAVGATARVRSIHGDAATVLGRLADASYDLVLLQADRSNYPTYLASARRLLRPGGMLVARGVLPVDEHRTAVTRFLHDLVEDPAFGTVVLPIDDGVALASRPPTGA